MNKRYYINMKEIMSLPRPNLRPVIFVTGWSEWLPLVVW